VEADLSDIVPGSRASNSRRAAAAADPPAGDHAATEHDAAAVVTSLYEIHAVGLIRLAVVMLGDRAAAEDAVQDAFCGLYRRYGSLAEPERALQYVRSSVLNSCRSELRARQRNIRRFARALPAPPGSPEYDVLLGEEHREVLAALRKLPGRQREALVLRYFLDLPAPEIARSMGISQGTVKSTTSRALAALARLVGDDR
jgi:RNA polymerase sigma-70 factor (sigma-E family)